MDETNIGGAFFTPLSAASNLGQDAFTQDKAPQLIIDWISKWSARYDYTYILAK